MSNKTIAKAWFAAIDNKDFAAVKKLMAARSPVPQSHDPATPRPR